jgi:hypothetical protein
MQEGFRAMTKAILQKIPHPRSPFCKGSTPAWRGEGFYKKGDGSGRKSPDPLFQRGTIRHKIFRIMSALQHEEFSKEIA